jgi:cyclic beta-1,2-glucan synthetase
MNTRTVLSESGAIVTFDRSALDHLPGPVQVLAGGQLSTMLTATGTGYIHHGPTAVTRWKPDPTNDCLGYLFYLRDLESNCYWSIGYQPTAVAPQSYSIEVGAGSVLFRRFDQGIAAEMQICVHAEQNFDVRRITLANRSDVTRTLELTSYAEIVLQDAAADFSHPAFSKLFVQTSRTGSGILVARRRPRGANEKSLSACHFLIQENREQTQAEFETDRAWFVGRGGSLRHPHALTTSFPLSGNLGAVLDPIFSLRTGVVLPPGASATVTFALGASYSTPQLLETAEELIESADPGEWFLHAEEVALQRLQQWGLSVADIPTLMAEVQPRLFGFRAAQPAGLTANTSEKVGDNGGLNGHFPAAVPRSSIEAILPEYLASHSLPESIGNGRVLSDYRGAAVSRKIEGPQHSSCEADHESAVTQETLREPNGIGGFSADGREYVVRLQPTADGKLSLPPLPWKNVVSNELAGFIASETGAGNTWAGNSRLNRLTPWQNDPVTDLHSDALYLRDEATGDFWSLTPGPVPQPVPHEVRHGWGYSRFTHTCDQLEQEVVQFAPCDRPVKVSRIRLTNHGLQTRRLRLYGYVHWELNEGQPLGRLAVSTLSDHDRLAVLASHPQRGEFSHGTAFAALTLSGSEMQLTADRTEFLGLHGDLTAPKAVVNGTPLSGRVGDDIDQCAALSTLIEIQPGQTIQGAFLLGECDSHAAATALIDRLSTAGAIDEALAQAQGSWRDTMASLQVETPAPAIDLMVNGWLPYQNLSCRIWGRSSSYQSGGAYGFRDQLQDSAAWIFHRPEITRRQILLNAAHQFVEGDVLHWWHPPLSKGIRTIFADDLLWLPLAASEYVAATGDNDLWQEQVRYLTAEQVPTGEAEIYLTPRDSGQRGSVYDHCCRALDRGLTTGRNGLPLMGCGDWNDGMNRVGQGGTGESVWMGFFIDYILERMLPVCRQFGDNERAERYGAYREQLRSALDDAGWDGGWYRRAYFDDGTPLGTVAADECRIDALVQAWSVLSGAAPADRAAAAIAAADSRLVDEDAGIIRLLDPPFDKMPQDPGYIKGYLPGVRENGGQYTHGVLWLIRAIAELGQGTRACQLLEMLSPVSHGNSPEVVATYKAEPYVVAADVYGQPPHVGRAGWPWYTGSAGWMFRVAVESILGLHLEQGRQLRIDPRIAADWPEFRVSYRLGDGKTRYEIRVGNPQNRQQGVQSGTLDGRPVMVGETGAVVPLVADGLTHQVYLEM